MSSLDNLEKALAVKAAWALRSVREQMDASKAPEKEMTNELFAPDIDAAIRFHLQYCLFRISFERVNTQQFKDANIKPLLLQLLQVYAIDHITKDTSGLYESGFFSAGSNRLLQDS